MKNIVVLIGIFIGQNLKKEWNITGGGRWKAIGKDKYSKTLTQIKNGEKDD